MAWINPVKAAIGNAADPTALKNLAVLEKGSEVMVSVVEKALTGKSFLVGDRLTLADLFVVAAIARGYQFVRLLRSYCEFMIMANIRNRCSQSRGRSDIPQFIAGT